MDLFCWPSEYHVIVALQNDERDRKTPERLSLFQDLEKRGSVTDNSHNESRFLSDTLKNKGFLLKVYMMNFLHLWNLSIAQKILYNGKRFFR